MDDISLINIIGYVLNVGVLALAYWLLKVRDRLLALEKDYTHLQEKVDGSADDIAEIKDTLNGMARNIQALCVELRAKGYLNGAHKPPNPVP